MNHETGDQSERVINMKEIEANKHAWGQLSKDHYETFKQRISTGTHKLNPYIVKEIGDLAGKKVIHLQCNTGADTMLLAQMAKNVVGVDLVPENVHYAKELAKDLKLTNVDFIESDIMKLKEIHHEKYDVVFVSEGAIGWLPDLKKWGETIKHLLKEDGFFYLFESHPFFNMLDESKLAKNILEVKYPYFGKQPDIEDSIGGYASETKTNVETYFWMHTVSDIINSLINAGLHMDHFNEFKEIFWDLGGMEKVDEYELYDFKFNRNHFPMSFSLKARF